MKEAHTDVTAYSHGRLRSSPTRLVVHKTFSVQCNGQRTLWISDMR